MCWICGKSLTREQFDSMSELQSNQIRDQAVVIAQKDAEIFNLKRNFELQGEQHDREVEALKSRIDELEWKKTREIYKGAERESDEVSR